MSEMTTRNCDACGTELNQYGLSADYHSHAELAWRGFAPGGVDGSVKHFCPECLVQAFPKVFKLPEGRIA